MAAIAIPRFSSIQDGSKVKADAATAAEIISAARIQETDTGDAVTGLFVAAGDKSLQPEYIQNPGTPQSNGGTGADFALNQHTDGRYYVTWKADTKSYSGNKIVIEGVPFDITSVATAP